MKFDDKNAISAPSDPAEDSPLLTREMVLPFLLVASLFPLWGFANDVTNPLVKAFKDIFLISHTQSSLVQFAFYLGYGVMAIPAAIFIRRFSYKAGILLGLALYATGALLFLPASWYAQFYYFLLALWILTCGLALLETTANPYILSMGHANTATRRLNLAQSFNPLGSLTGMFVASNYILGELKVEAFREAQKAAHPEFANMLPAAVDAEINLALHQLAADNPLGHQAMQSADLAAVRGPYLVIAGVVLLLFCIFLFCRLPKSRPDHPFSMEMLRQTGLRLLANRRYVEGVISQAFYVGAQIMCWTFIIHYGVTVVGISAAQAQNYNIIAMTIFLTSRFVCTLLLGFVKPGNLLLTFGLLGVGCCLGAILLPGMAGLYSLIGISACMSLMFPTIYGIALKDMGEDASLASAGLIMAIVGGALMPMLQGMFIDQVPTIAGLPSVKSSFILPALCIAIVALYGYRSVKVHA